MDQFSVLFRLFSGIILLYAMNNLYLIWSTRKYERKATHPLDYYPKVSVQLPVYNEKEVISRFIDTVSRMKWPKESLEILILDDSDDETSSIIDEKIAQSQVNVGVLRREKRDEFKAGALQNGLLHTDAKYIAIFDADFLPETDFLNQVIPVLEKDESIGLGPDEVGTHKQGLQ